MGTILGDSGMGKFADKYPALLIGQPPPASASAASTPSPLKAPPPVPAAKSAAGPARGGPAPSASAGGGSALQKLKVWFHLDLDASSADRLERPFLPSSLPPVCCPRSGQSATGASGLGARHHVHHVGYNIIGSVPNHNV